MNRFLKVNRQQIIQTATGKPVILKGVNLGGWLMMEAYIIGAPNRPEKMFRQAFAQQLGNKALEEFDEAFRSNFIREEDIRTIAGLGLNCIRVPFHFRAVETSPFKYGASGLKFLDKVIGWAKKYKISVILDLHCAPGSQNKDWHADSDGKVLFWKSKLYQDRVYALWEFLADRYKDETTVAGYDLLNESVLEDTALLNRFYKTLIKRVRKIDRNHILFVEGSNWAMDIDCLEEFDDDNYVLSIHSYLPSEFTFNFVSDYKYPHSKGAGPFTKLLIRQHMSKYAKTSQKRQVPIFLGEFGVNYRQGFFGEHLWVKDMLECCKEFQFHWTYWPFKTVKSYIFPDGVFSYYENPPWVNRMGPASGWETYASFWPTMRQKMIRSWRSESFRPNTHIIQLLKNAAR